MIDSFANRLRGLRKEKRISQEELAVMMEVSRSAVASWETGKRFPPPTTVRKLALYFNVSSDYLCGRTTEKRNIVASPVNGIDLRKLNSEGLKMLAEYYRLLAGDARYSSK